MQEKAFETVLSAGTYLYYRGYHKTIQSCPLNDVKAYWRTPPGGVKKYYINIGFMKNIQNNEFNDVYFCSWKLEMLFLIPIFEFLLEASYTETLSFILKWIHYWIKSIIEGLLGIFTSAVARNITKTNVSKYSQWFDTKHSEGLSDLDSTWYCGDICHILLRNCPPSKHAA